MVASRETNKTVNNRKVTTAGKVSEPAERDAETIRQDLLVTEIETSDGHLGTILGNKNNNFKII